jgi:hypothetical protein
MSPESTSQITAGLLMLSLASVLTISMLLCVFVASCIKQRRAAGRKARRKEFPDSVRQQFSCPTFDNPCRWLVIKSANVPAVQTALGLDNPIQCSWDEGFAKLSEHDLFISPPVQGWILVVGSGLPDPFDEIDECYKFVLRLSREFGHVQFFAANRIVNHHAWVRAEGSRVIRAYAWAGETLWNQGGPSPAESDLNVHCFDYGEEPETFTLSGQDTYTTNADKVMFLAARWSFDPTSVDEEMVSTAYGIAGDLNPTRR